MRKSTSMRILLLAVMLAASQVAFASHITIHFSSSISSCEWCVCQGQTFAAPLPDAATGSVLKQAEAQLQQIEITLPSAPDSRSHQPRAPPSTP